VETRRHNRSVNVVSLHPQSHRHGATALGEANDGDLALARHELARRHRNFRVLRAIKADSTPSIQKRTTTCASSQPFTSKWWCRGARLNTRCSRAYSSPYRRLRYLYTNRCRMKESLSV